MYIVGVNGVELFLLGRTLMKIGEDALPEPPGGSARYAGSARLVLIVASDIAAHPDTAVGEIAARTGRGRPLLPWGQARGGRASHRASFRTSRTRAA